MVCHQSGTDPELIVREKVEIMCKEGRAELAGLAGIAAARGGAGESPQLLAVRSDEVRDQWRRGGMGGAKGV